MGQLQSCFVCGSRGLLVEDRIQVTAAANAAGGPTLIGQCPRCHRFICSRHGELLDLSGKRRWPWQGSRPLTVCCPFDPDTPLGDVASALGSGYENS
ncbi:MAG TPA: hypothetical protein VGQ69_14435 [Gemmatimonadales bacterium]|jgi:hypothetical protein|nr:hypothetical protein [Gemmatimonadales bacterium]